MSAYFRKYRKGNFFEKVLIKKAGGSLYPNFNDFSNKINLLKKYLGGFVVDTKISYRNNRYYVKQPIVIGVDLFDCLKNSSGRINKQKLRQFTFCLNKLYKDTKILPDLIGNHNIFFTKECLTKILIKKVIKKI